MGVVRVGPPEELVLKLQEILGLTEFIETGTFRGDTAAWAARHFARVCTIEWAQSYHTAAVERFRTTSNVQALRGHSTEVLQSLVPTLTAPALFWLDAHWSGGDTAGSEAECPVLAEISCIAKSPLAHVILVDDARLFCAPPPRPHRATEWPDLATTVAALAGSGVRHVALIDDVLIAVPTAATAALTDFLQDLTTARNWEKGVAKWWRKFRQ